ncbi:DUF6089 family protein [Aridibaculum aurantiacum]|uniref:DUF6089 family protein n=1 Tax=Aridibaculum aurantiacum TaxID=2810307 RepID=UPI001A967186|nr:DUF6089 family protein [Aridibaculum aurantiacum]
MRNLLTSLIFLNFLSPAFSQPTQIQVFGGAANYQGDLQYGTGRLPRYTLKQARAVAGIGAEFGLTARTALRASFSIGKIGADDKISGHDVKRNLNFITTISEVMVGGQYYLLDPSKRVVAPYVFAGIAVFKFNPYTYDTVGNKHFLKPLSTEGQGILPGKEHYALTQFAIPFGGGIKGFISNRVYVGLEIGMRKTFTDYLDDVSSDYVDENVLLAARGPVAVALAYRGNELQGGHTYPAAGASRGRPSHKDWYYFTTAFIGYRFVSASRWKNSLKCPKVN